MSTHRQRLISGLDGEPQAWTWTGHIYDLEAATGVCVCGHPIRFEYEVKHDRTGERRMLGSHCIMHYEEYRPEDARKMRARAAELVAQAKEEKKRAAQAVLDKRYTEVETEYARLWLRMSLIADLYVEADLRMPSDLWWAARGGHCPQKRNKYVRIRSQIKWYEEGAQKIRRALDGAYSEVDLRGFVHQRHEAYRRAKTENIWLADLLSAADPRRTSGFISDMLYHLDNGRPLTMFSERQREVMCEIVCRPYSTSQGKKLRAEEYFMLAVEGRRPQDGFAEYVEHEPPQAATHASLTADDDLPF